MSSSSSKMPSRGTPAAGPVLALLLAGATFIGGYYLGSMAGQKAGYRLGSEETTATLKTKVEASGIFPKAIGETRSLSGKVTAVRADGFDIETLQGRQNPFDESAPSKRMIKVSSTTKFTKMTSLSPAEIEAAQKEFSEAMLKFSEKPGEQPPTPPLPFKLEDATLSGLSNGMMVTVTSETDIAMAATINATAVSIQPAIDRGPNNAGAPQPPGSPPMPPTAPSPSN